MEPRKIIVSLKKWSSPRLSWNIFIESRCIRLSERSRVNDLLLGSVETYFLEVGAYVSLKGATAGVSEGHFCWIWLEISQFLKYKNGVVRPKNLIVSLLKWSCLRVSRNIFVGSRWIRVSETSHCRCLRGWFLLNLTGNITCFQIWKRRIGTYKIDCLIMSMKLP